MLLLAGRLPWPALAVQPDEILADPALEARARDISQAAALPGLPGRDHRRIERPVARDLRLLVRERLTAGDSDDQVLAFVVARLRRIRAVPAAGRGGEPDPVARRAGDAAAGLGCGGLLPAGAQGGGPMTGALSEAEQARLDDILKD